MFNAKRTTNNIQVSISLRSNFLFCLSFFLFIICSLLIEHLKLFIYSLIYRLVVIKILMDTCVDSIENYARKKFIGFSSDFEVVMENK